MINRSIHWENNINLYAVNKRVTKYMKQPVTEMKDKIRQFIDII